MKKRIGILLLAAALGMPTAVKADYRYDSFGNAIPCQYSFTAEENYNGQQLGIGSFSKPMDLYVGADDRIYIADTGNGRIVILNDRFEVENVLDDIRYQGKKEKIKGISGIFVQEDGTIYVADRRRNRILAMDQTGNVSRIITKPDSNLLKGNSAKTFKPRKILVDSRDIVYMISENSTQGAYMIDADGEFLGFYGRNKVSLTFDRMFEIVMRQFASRENRGKMQNFIPVEFSNFDIDGDGFVYTVTGYSEKPRQDEMLKKLNPLGNNILSETAWMDYGDMPDMTGEEPVYRTSYTDVAVDGDGFIYALDSRQGRIYQFDNEGVQQTVFGGKGACLGTFTAPTAIDTLGDQVLVLDRKKNNLTVFRMTYFGSLVKKAFLLYNDGYYRESKEYFEEIVKLDANYDWAYAGLGSAYYEEGDWEAARDYFRKSNIATQRYSEVKGDLRNKTMKKYFSLIFFGVIVLMLLLMAVKKLVSAAAAEKRRKELMEEMREGRGGE